MNDQNELNPEDTIDFELTLRNYQSEVEYRYMAFGLSPMILIEPKQYEDDHVGITIDSTGLDEEELIDMLELVVTGLKEGKEL